MTMENKISKLNDLTTSLVKTIRELEKSLKSEGHEIEINTILKIEDVASIHQLDVSKAFSDLRAHAREKLRQLYPYEEETPK